MPAFAGVILATLSSGCSFLFVHGPPANHKQMQYFDCSSSNVLPVIDSIIGASAVLGVAAAASDSSAFETSQTKKTALGVYGVETALFVGSAVYGFKKTSDCRAAQADAMARMPPLLPPVGGPPAPVVDPWTGRPVAPPLRP